MLNASYRVAVYGSRLHEKTGRYIGELCAFKTFYFKKNIIKWAREQINRPDIHPTSVKFYFKKGNGSLNLKCESRFPRARTECARLYGKVVMFEVIVIMLSSFGLGCCSMFMFRRYLDRKNIFRSYYAQGLFLVRNWGRQT